MEIIYSVSVLILMISFILIKKTDKKINILKFISITIVLTFCYNTFVCYVLTFFTIKCSLLNLSIINIVIIILNLIMMLRKKQVQSYELRKTDLIYIGLIGVVVLAVSYKNFGFPFNIKYETSDPSVHYLTSVMFAEEENLLVEPKDEVYANFATRKTASYVNSGLLMKILCPELGAMDCYNVFVCFGIFILFMTGWTFYSSLMHFTKGKKMQFVAWVITVICIMGYPLNSFLFGFEYLSMGLLIICALISMVTVFEEESFKMIFIIPIFAFLNFGLFSAYYMFVPFVYPALWIYFCINSYAKDKKIVTKKNIVLLITTLLIPFVLGYIYHLAPEIYRVFINKTLNYDTAMDYSSFILNKGLATNGYIYINLYSNMLLLLPLTIYLFIKHKKENKFIALLVCLAIAFIAVLLVGRKFGKVSIYYLSKNYFVLWIALLYCNYKALVKLDEKDKWIPIICTLGYVTISIIYIIFSNVEVKYVLRNKYETPFATMEIFGANKTILKEVEEFNKDEIDILMYAKENLDKTTKIEVVADNMQYYWTYVLLRYFNHEEFTNKYGGQQKLNAKIYKLKDNINNVDYVIYFNRSKQFKKYEDRLFDNSETIYQNEYGGIIKYNLEREN